MHRVVDATIPLLGRRGAALLLTGILWLFIAWGVSIMPLPTNRPFAPHEYAPIGLRVTAWAATGLFAIASAFMWKEVRAKDGLPILDRLGFALLIVMPMERMLSWTVVLVLHIPGMPHIIPLPAFAIALAGFAVWLVVCLHLFLINGWQEPLSTPEVAELGKK